MKTSTNHNPLLKSPIRRLEVERVFKYIDENHDGKISPAELKRCIHTVAGRTTDTLTDEEAEAAVRSSDSDGDGFLSVEDLERIMEAKGMTEEESLEELREAFGMYEEKPGSGRITARSLRRVMGRLGEKKTVRECEVMISRFDVDGDGVLSFQEFAAMMGQ